MALILEDLSRSQIRLIEVLSENEMAPLSRKKNELEDLFTIPICSPVLQVFHSVLFDPEAGSDCRLLETFSSTKDEGCEVDK